MPVDEAWLSRLKIEPLDRRRHDRVVFSCGVERIDNFLKSTAARQADEDLTKVYVAVEPPSNSVLGYYSISAHAVDIQSLPEKDRKRMPRYQTVPALYLSMIAVDRTVQSRGLGKYLMGDMFKLGVAVADKVGAYFIVLDALNEEAAGLYRRLGFHELPTSGRETRMLIAMATVRRAIAAAAT